MPQRVQIQSQVGHPAEHLPKVAPLKSATGNVEISSSRKTMKKKKKKLNSFLLLRCEAADRLDRNGAGNIAARHRHRQLADKSEGLQDDVLEAVCGRESSEQLEMVFFFFFKLQGIWQRSTCVSVDALLPFGQMAAAPSLPPFLLRLRPQFIQR